MGDLGGHRSALQGHHEAEAVLDFEVVKLPVVHVGNEANAVGGVVLDLVEGVHDVTLIINNLHDRRLFWEVASGALIEAVVSLLGLNAGNREERLQQERRERSE